MENITERLTLYYRLDNCADDGELDALHRELADRFGPVPERVEDLFRTVRCRRLGVELGFERLVLKQETLRCYFVSNPDSPYFESPVFQSVMKFAETRLANARLKESNRHLQLAVQDVSGMPRLLQMLGSMKAFVTSNESFAG